MSVTVQDALRQRETEDQQRVARLARLAALVAPTHIEADPLRLLQVGGFARGEVVVRLSGGVGGPSFGDRDHVGMCWSRKRGMVGYRGDGGKREGILLSSV